MARSIDDLLGTDERVVHETRQHWFVLFRLVGLHLLVLAILLWLAISSGNAGWLDNRVGGWVNTAFWVATGIVLVLALWQVLGWWVERLYLTTSKIVYVRGVLDRDVTSTPLVKIDEVTLCRPIIGRALGYGRLDVENASGGTEPLAGLAYLPKPIEIYRMLTERARHQRMLEGGGRDDLDGDGLVDERPAPAPAPAPAADPAPRPIPGDPTS